MAGKGKSRTARGKKRKTREVCSLDALQRLLDKHAKKKELKVRVWEMSAISDASSVKQLLQHQAEVREWVLMGMRRVEALVEVDGLIGASVTLLDQAIRYMKTAVASATHPAISTDAYVANDDKLVTVADRLGTEGVLCFGAENGATTIDDQGQPLDTRCIGTEDTAVVNVAERMLEMGTGLRGAPLVPSAALLDLAARVVHGDVPATDSARDVMKTVDLTAQEEEDVYILSAEEPAIPFQGHGEPFVPNLTRRISAEDTATFNVAERMLEMGTGLRSAPLLPSAALLDLAARVVHGDDVPATASAPDIMKTVDLTAEKDVYFCGTATINMAERMPEMGTGLCYKPLHPSAALLNLAARIVHDEGPSSALDMSTHDNTEAVDPAAKGAAICLDAEDGPFPTDGYAETLVRGPVLELTAPIRSLLTALLDSGTTLRHHRLGSFKVQRVVQNLGREIEDVAAAALTEVHPIPLLLHLVRRVQVSVSTVRGTPVSRRQFKCL